MFDDSSLERQLAEARASLQAVRQPDAGEGIGDISSEASDGRIKITIGADGRIENIDLDPRILREGSEYIAAELRTGINAALDERAEAMSGNEPMPDLEAMNDTMARLQDQGIRQMKDMSAAISDVMRKLHGK